MASIGKARIERFFVCLLCFLSVNLVKRKEAIWWLTCVNWDISLVLDDEALSSVLLKNRADVTTLPQGRAALITDTQGAQPLLSARWEITLGVFYTPFSSFLLGKPLFSSDTVHVQTENWSSCLKSL